MCSAMRMPGNVVGIVLNSPRISTGASGFGSNVSMCDGPPCIHSRMQLTCLRFALGCSARSFRNCGNDKPIADSAPTRKKERRDTPEQSWLRPVVRSSIEWNLRQSGGKAGAGPTPARGGITVVSSKLGRGSRENEKLTKVRHRSWWLARSEVMNAFAIAPAAYGDELAVEARSDGGKPGGRADRLLERHDSSVAVREH